jgi:hypothetical protein
MKPRIHKIIKIITGISFYPYLRGFKSTLIAMNFSLVVFCLSKNGVKFSLLKSKDLLYKSINKSSSKKDSYLLVSLKSTLTLMFSSLNITPSSELFSLLY